MRKDLCMELLDEETRRLEKQLADGQKILAGGVFMDQDSYQG